MTENAVSPTYAEIAERTRKLVSENKDVVEWIAAGTSEKDRTPLPFVKITDNTVPVDEKQVMIVTGGVHGCEECGRATVMAFAEWLVSSGRPHLSTQCFLICPCLNPDGTRINRSETGTGKNICFSFSPGTDENDVPEAAAVWTLVNEYYPECCVDVHGLAGGSFGDTIYVTPGLSGNLSTQIGFATAYEMSEQAASAGFCQRDPYLQKEYNDLSSGLCWVKKAAWELNALSFTVETTEHLRPLSESVWSGLTRLIRLVEIGERQQWYQPYPGYPVDILTDSGVTALMPHGTTPGERRRSRKELMDAIHEDGIWHVDRDAADNAAGTDRRAGATLTCRKQLKSYPSRFTIQLMLDRRAKTETVMFNGETLTSDPVHGFEERITEQGRFVRVHINREPRPGDNRVEVLYQVPEAPHDPLPAE